MTYPADLAAEPPHDQIRVPKPILYSMIALMLFALVSIATARAMQVGVTHEGRLVPIEQASFRFTDPAKAAIIATRTDGRSVELAKAGEEIIPRLILRSVVNERMRDGAPQLAPLTLEITGDGQRLLIDQTTGHIIRLAAFGVDNDQMFDAILGKAA